MEKGFVNRDRAAGAHDQAAEVEGALDLSAAPVTPHGAPVLDTALAANRAMRHVRLNASFRQTRAQRVAVVGAIGNRAMDLLTRSSRAMSAAHADQSKHPSLDTLFPVWKQVLTTSLRFGCG